MQNDYSKYGFVPRNKKNDYSKYGFVPREQQEQEDQLTEQPQQSINPQIRVPNTLQNNPIGGVLTSLANQPHSIGQALSFFSNLASNHPLAAGFGGLPDLGMVGPGALRSLAELAKNIPEVKAPESPTVGYNIGHFGAEVAPYVYGAYKAAPLAYKAVTQGIPYLLKNAGKIGGKIFPRYAAGQELEAAESMASRTTGLLSKEGISSVEEPMHQLYNDVFKGTEKIPVIQTGNPHLDLRKVANVYGSETISESPITFSQISAEQPGIYDANLTREINSYHAHPTGPKLQNIRKRISESILDTESKAIRAGGSGESVRSELSYLKTAKNLVDKEISAHVARIRPEAMGKFQEANRLRAQVVEPYHNAQRIKKGLPDNPPAEALAKKFTKEFESEQARERNPIPPEIRQQVETINQHLKNYATKKENQIKDLQKLGWGVGTSIALGSFGTSSTLKKILSGL